MALLSPPKTVLIIGANGYIGHAVALAFVRAGYATYGLVRHASLLPSLAAEEIIPLLGSPSSPIFLAELGERCVVFDVLVSTTEQIIDYFPHFNDVVKLLRTLAQKSLEKKGKKPLVLFTSGCKDYGPSPYLSTSPNLSPHTENSPLNPPTWAIDRAHGSLQIFNHTDVFDAAILRPTNVYGRKGSYYGLFFSIASSGKEKGVLEVSQDPNTVLHAMHVDDCAEAYVALAEHADQSAFTGECFNISSGEYETLDGILQTLVLEYRIEGGVGYLGKGGGGDVDAGERELLMGFGQWVGSEKLRGLTGWRDKRMGFSEGVHQYRIAYEAAKGMESGT